MASGEGNMRTGYVGLIAFLALLVAPAARAVPTEIVVRVLAKDAKFVGHESGGMKITLRDAQSGEILAQGMTEGGRGSTDHIMKTGLFRRDDFSKGAPKFSAVLDLQKPRLIQVTATGPIMLKDAALTVTATQWVLPGKPINHGDGWLLELPGFAVLLADALPRTVNLGGKPATIPIKAKITMQCACVIEPGGLWDPKNFQIGVMLEKAGKSSPATPLAYAGEASTFRGALKVSEPGDYFVEVFAYDPSNGNTGLAKVPLNVR
jgi:hypothetical protein